MASNEFRTNLIQGWYQKFLGRAATGFELSIWLGALGSGTVDEDVISDIVSSNEYFSQGRVGGDNTNFVRALYLDLLGRPATDSDISTWVISLNAHTVTRVQVAKSIISSFDYQVHIIRGWYQRYLGRPASDAEVNATRIFLASPGITDEDVIASIVGSLEYFARAGLCGLYLPLVRR